jgi:hypothetical protein
MDQLDALFAQQDNVLHQLAVNDCELPSYEQRTRQPVLKAQLAQLHKKLDAIYAEHIPTW